MVTLTISEKWSRVGHNPIISNNGKYAEYDVSNAPGGRSAMVVLATDNTWRKELTDGDQNSVFTKDNRILIFKNDGDSLGMLVLGTNVISYIPNVGSFVLSASTAGEWLVYQRMDSLQELILYNLSTTERLRLLSASDFKCSDNGKSLVALTRSNVEGPETEALQWVDLEKGTIKQIWKGANILRNYIFDSSGSRVAFEIGKEENADSHRSIFCYNANLGRTLMLVNGEKGNIDDGLQVGDLVFFSHAGDRLFINLTEKPVRKTSPTGVQLDVYSYRDPELQSLQLYELSDRRNYTAMIDIENDHLIRLEQPGDWIDLSGLYHKGYSDNFFIIRHVISLFGNEFNWNSADSTFYYLIDCRNGKRRLIIGEDESSSIGPWLTPMGKYVVFYDARKLNYCSYSVSTGIIKNITKGIVANWTRRGDLEVSHLIPEGIAGFLDSDRAVIIKDQNDLFQIGLDGRTISFNLTGGYGHRHNIVFRPILDRGSLSGSKYYYPILKSYLGLVLKSFNLNNKDDGFYRISMVKADSPRRLMMMPYMFCGLDETEYGETFIPVKAKETEGYLLLRQSAEESPNLFYTSDFKSFTQLSEVKPERNVNWLTSSLITWRTLDGKISQGILYRPENFDPSKKYPILFFYYEKFSETLHQFLYPKADGAWIDIPSYVSDGYLVFVPDIHFKIGSPGESVFNTVVSAAQYLSKMPSVDAKRMGIQGHSRGGYETNYLVTHTHIFAAAMSGSGMSDYVALSGSVRPNGMPRRSGFEVGSQRLGATLWERPDLYIYNSPIFYVDKVTTPILMMSNRMDGDVPYEQGIEFFTSLRRLGKTAWMLQYDGQGHMASGMAAADLSVRMKQFFDFYLKDALAPKWMVEGIPATLKGLDDGLELESRGISPGPGLLNTDEKRKIRDNGRRKPITITIK